jgi:hypothetical protein
VEGGRRGDGERERVVSGSLLYIYQRVKEKVVKSFVNWRGRRERGFSCFDFGVSGEGV